MTKRAGVILVSIGGLIAAAAATLLLMSAAERGSADGLPSVKSDLRDWLDEDDGRRLPKGEFGVDNWITDADTVDRVRELYPPSSEMRAKLENDRRLFLTAMAEIKRGTVPGVDKNVYVEPAIWTIEWARDFYVYPLTRSN